jgi:hypothetical protein
MESIFNVLLNPLAITLILLTITGGLGYWIYMKLSGKDDVKELRKELEVLGSSLDKITRIMENQDQINSELIRQMGPREMVLVELSKELKVNNIEQVFEKLQEDGINNISKPESPLTNSIKGDSGTSGSTAIKNNGVSSDEVKKNYKVSISYPLLLSKRHESVFLFQLYLPEKRSQVTGNMRTQFQDGTSAEFVEKSKVEIGQKIQVEFFSPQFDFSKPVIKPIGDEVVKIIFLGAPKDTCEPGNRNIRVSISDDLTKQEVDSFNIQVKVVDFAFDHISRPLLSKFVTSALGLGSFIMFTLTLLEQIDKTVGLTSGTASGVLAAMIYSNFYNLYQRAHPN